MLPSRGLEDCICPLFVEKVHLPKQTRAGGGTCGMADVIRRVMVRQVVAVLGVGAVAGALVGVPPLAASGRPWAGGSVVPSAVVSPVKARRIAAVWGGALTYLPRWAPKGVVVTHWWSGTCACGTDDNRLVVQFVRRSTRLDWVVSDPDQIDRTRAGVVCTRRRPAAVINRRAIFYRKRGTFETAWACIAVSGRWAPGFDLLRRLTISVTQRADAGRLRALDLERMVASAHAAPRGSALGARFELPSRSEVARMARAFRRPLLMPAELPRGFIYSDWTFAARAQPGYDDRRQLSVAFGRDSLFARITWTVYAGADRFDCPNRTSQRWPRRGVIDGRPIYVNEAIHGVSVWTCLPPRAAGNVQPLEAMLWYDIRLHRPAMLRLAMRMVGKAKAG